MHPLKFKSFLIYTFEKAVCKSIKYRLVNYTLEKSQEIKNTGFSYESQLGVKGIGT